MKYMWNPWHGCHKCSAGCLYCYMYEQDKNIGINSNKVTLNRTQFRLPVRKFRDKTKKSEKYELQYKIPSGSVIMTCLTSDFFIEEADVWRHEAWEFIHERKDCLFIIITKRPERIEQCLPDNWLDGWHNVYINVTCETNEMAWLRMPIVLDLPIKHIGMNLAPMLEKMDIRPFLSSGLIEQVSVGGESYIGYEGLARTLEMTWVKDIKEQCEYYDTDFEFYQTGSRLKLENGQIIGINPRDERGLAEFYNLNNFEHRTDWKATIKEMEMQELAENAHKIYKQITLGDLGLL